VSSHETLGLLLVRDGVITRPQLYDALRLQRQDGRLLGTCLLSLGYLSPESLLQILSRQLSIPALQSGTLSLASAQAVSRVPGDLAWRLKILPYSWDGKILGVAVADGRALNHLHEVAFHAQAAVGAYVALEEEIETTLRRVYGADHHGSQTSITTRMAGRPRPARMGPLSEVPSRDFGAALGLEGSAEPVLLDKPKRQSSGKGTAPIAHPPPPAPAAIPFPQNSAPIVIPAHATAIVRAQPSIPAEASPARHLTVTNAPTLPPAPAGGPKEITRVAFYDAVEQVYAVETTDEVAGFVGRALLNYFSRVLILRAVGEHLATLGFAGTGKPPALVTQMSVPHVAMGLSQRNIAYGHAEEDPRCQEIWTACGLSPSPVCLVASIAGRDGIRLVVYGDNSDRDELYEDLHDVQLLFKEAETALGLLESDR